MARSLAIVCTLVAFAAPWPMDDAVPSVRFHHFHFQVGEPAAAMNFGMTALNGSRVLLRGLGVGVRVGAEYALFDRIDVSEIGPAVRPSAEAAYTAARDWLRAHGVEVAADAGGARASLSATFAGDVLDHVAFTAADTAVVIATLRAHGAQPFRVTDDSTFFRIAEAAVVEIVRDPDAPDAFWCPMHPDVRSAGPGKCPVCGMDLVPIPPPRLGEYRMDVAVTPGARGIGASKLRVTLRDPESGRPVSAFATIHERLLHVFIIDRRLEYFQHVHPEPAGDGVFELKQDVPPGEYVLIADFLPQGGRAQMLQRAIVTPGYRGALFPPTPHLVPDPSTEKADGGVRVRLDASGLKAGKEAGLRFTLTDMATGAPVSDLEPFLGAAGHMLIVNADLTEANHVHPEEPATRGPSMTFQPLMPASGLYKLWLQFQRHGLVVTIPFVVSVQGP
jgi:hypothetical protein